MSHHGRTVPTNPHRLEHLDLQPVRIGMPHLCRAGLSENWLLKECGHRHWLALADAYGLDAPDFRGLAGERLYPAFIAIDLAGRGLGSVRENDVLHFDLTLIRSGQTRFRSQINITLAGCTIAAVTMETAFVHRAIPGANRSATRSVPARPCALLPPETRPQAVFRADGWQDWRGFAREDRREIATLVLDPSPHEDFNGADFLYFAAFQAMLDRAEWVWLRQASPLLETLNRTICYLGNVELGERVRAVLCGRRDADDGLHLWIELRREIDDTLIAITFTRRGPLRNDLLGNGG